MTLKEVEKYKKLSGDNDKKTTIPKMISFLDGYEVGCNKTIDMALEIIDNIAHTAFAAEDYHNNEGGKCVIQLMREAFEELKVGDIKQKF